MDLKYTMAAIDGLHVIVDIYRHYNSVKTIYWPLPGKPGHLEIQMAHRIDIYIEERKRRCLSTK